MSNLIKRSTVFDALDKIKLSTKKTIKQYRENDLIEFGSAVQTGWVIKDNIEYFDKTQFQIYIYIKFEEFKTATEYSCFDYYAEKGKTSIQFLRRGYYENIEQLDALSALFEEFQPFFDEMETKLKKTLDKFFV